ncbi:MAG: hypothetical protein DWQ01_21880 [Planctomycetota bacterium]|nr:MAG: hypothetical protein DWQ01_21880 [Planctomycetota bacterium]
MAALAAAVDRDQGSRLQQAASALYQQDGAEIFWEVLRQMHLFCGFPKVVRTLHALGDQLPSQAGESAGASDRVQGQTVFEKLYGKDAEAVQQRLIALDPVLGNWILDHAYGRVLGRSGLSVEERERLAVLALAASNCWQQWRSHVRNSLRLGVPKAILISDLEAGNWLTAAQKEQARDLLLAEGD